MKKFYRIIAIIIIGLLLKSTPSCYAMEAEEAKEPIVIAPASSLSFNLPMHSLPSQLHFAQTPFACFKAHHLPTNKSTANSTKIRQDLWLVSWIYDANDLPREQRNELAKRLQKSKKLCCTYDHPAKEIFTFVKSLLKSPEKKIQANIQSSLMAFLEAPKRSENSKNLDIIEMKLFFISLLNNQFNDKEKIMLLAHQLISADKAEIAAHYLYTIGGEAMLSGGDYEGYLLLAAQHNHKEAKKVLDRIRSAS